MSMYEIKVLSNDEFNEVAKSDPRYEYVDDTNMGFADRQKGVAYIRGTNIHDLNKYLISHELEELEANESTHEDPNGIRHKKGGFVNVVKRIFNPLNFQGIAGLGTGREDEGAFGTGPRTVVSKISDIARPILATVAGSALGGTPGSLAAGTLTSGLPGKQQQPSFQVPDFGGGMEFAQPPPPPITASPRPTGALSSFSVAGPASSQIPSEIGGNVAPILGGQAFQNPIQNVGRLLNPDLAERLRGFYAGRLTF